MRLRGKISYGRLYIVKFYLYRVLKYVILNNILRNIDLGDKDIYRLKKKLL